MVFYYTHLPILYIKNRRKKRNKYRSLGKRKSGNKFWLGNKNREIGKEYRGINFGLETKIGK
jgi:hypothetical protein